MTDDRNAALIELTADIVSAHLSNNNVAAGDVPTLIRSVHEALTKATTGYGNGAAGSQVERPVPMVGVRKSLSNPEHILSLIDGKPYKSLKRHITRHGYTPDSYREAFSLPASYPMVAPAYSERRRAVAKELGLGRKKGERPAAKAPPQRRVRKSAAPSA